LRDLRQPLDILQYENAAVDFDQPRFTPPGASRSPPPYKVG